MLPHASLAVNQQPELRQDTAAVMSRSEGLAAAGGLPWYVARDQRETPVERSTVNVLLETVTTVRVLNDSSNGRATWAGIA
jgi:hypothetical protein